jgi:hypothetical protein
MLRPQLPTIKSTATEVSTTRATLSRVLHKLESERQATSPRVGDLRGPWPPRAPGADRTLEGRRHVNALVVRTPWSVRYQERKLRFTIGIELRF